MSLPFTTPEALAADTGWSERRVRKLARDLGACRVVGNRMVLLPIDVIVILKAAKPRATIEEIKAWAAQWIPADATELADEAEAQNWAAPTGVVYFVQRAQMPEVKIGYTIDLAKRLTNFRSASTDQFSALLTIPGTPALEKYFHEKFAVERITREWFRLGEPIREFIARRQYTISRSAP